jgi:LysR family transcriptional activator of nhaA
MLYVATSKLHHPFLSLRYEGILQVQGKTSGQPLRLDVGVVDLVPKLVVGRLLQPAFALESPVRVVCRENSLEPLLAGLALHSLDIVISDAPLPSGSNVRAFNHLLGETAITFFGKKALARSRRANFPRSLHGAPMLLPLENSILRRSLNQWFEREQIEPRVVAEFEDSALLKVFGAEGLGVFAGPSIVEAEIERQYDVQAIGRAEEVRERFYAISVERRLKHPAVVAITDAARHELFA